MHVSNFELIYQSDKPLLGPAKLGGAEEDFCFCSAAGVIYAHTNGGTSVCHEAQTPLMAAVPDGMSGFFLAASADRTLRHYEREGAPGGDVLLRSFNGDQLLGVTSLLYDIPGNRVFFTDAGPWAQTGLHRPAGSVFELHLDDSAPRALAHRCLAYPAGLALSPKKDVLYFCEVARNTVLRVVLTLEKPLLLVFHQFNGGIGVRALACMADGRVVVAHSEAHVVRSNGALSFLSVKGALIERIELPRLGRINGLLLLEEESFVATEDGGTCYRFSLTV